MENESYSKVLIMLNNIFPHKQVYYALCINCL